MHELNLVDHSFDLRLTSEYHLSIQLGLDGFSFSILDLARSNYIVFRHTPLIVGKPQFLSKKVETIFEEEQKLNASYKSVSITYSTIHATLFPREFAEGADSIKVAALTSDTARTEDIRTEKIPGFNYELVYNVPKEILSLFNSKFADFRFSHKTVPLLSTFLAQRNEKRNSLLVNFEKKYIRIIAVKGSDIVLYNSFYFKNEADFLYHTLNVWHTLRFDAERDEMLLGGFVADDSVYIRQIKKYISNVLFLKPAEDFHYGNLFDKSQKHQFISLLNTYICV